MRNGRERRLRRSLTALIGVLAAVACDPDLPPALGDRITDSALEVVDGSGSEWVIGEHVVLSELEGKPIVLDFWASWCGACHEYVAGLKATYGDRIEVVGVLFDDTPENGRVWLRKQGATYPTVLELRQDLADEFWLRGLPYFALLTPDRRLSWDFLGVATGPNFMHHDSVAVRLEAMLGS
jgi:thiol-disulfide isomerase/thioredoxin